MPNSFDSLLLGRRQTELTLALVELDHLDQAPQLAGKLRDLQGELADKGLGGDIMTRLISLGNDRLSMRVIELTAAKHRLPPVDWCWLALGSEGRHEQTFVTDQDNGLIFNAANAREAEAMRTLFLPFAQEANQHLAACGFKLCSGQIMAGNPAWCLSFEEWRERFIDWVRRPEPAALLNASIFFDLRPLVGNLELGENLRTLLLGLTSDTPSFLYLMAENALQAQPPLNFRGEIAVEEGETLDLKKFASRIFVDAARIFALASGVRAVHTAERLRDAGGAVGLNSAEVEAMNAAFSHILRLRLGQQLADRKAGRAEGGGLNPAGLHELDRVILRESLRQARRLQQRLKLNYSL